MQMKCSRFIAQLFLCAVLVVAGSIWTTRLFAKPATNGAPATYVTATEIVAALRRSGVALQRGNDTYSWWVTSNWT